METTILTVLALSTMVLSNPVMTRQELMIQAHKARVCFNLIHFNNFYYTAGESKPINGFPTDMIVHWKTGNVYYRLVNDEMDDMSIQKLRPSGEMETIKLTGMGQSTAVDNLNDIVYIATDNGVYKYKDDGSIEPYTALGEDVMYLTVSNDGTVMYIVTWPEYRVQKITNDGQTREEFPAIPNSHGLYMDTRNNIFCEVGPRTSYVLKKGHSIPIKIKGLPRDKMTNVLVTRSHKVLVMDQNSNLYALNAENASAKRLGSFNVTGVDTFALDSADNILIGVRGNILKFNAYKQNPCSDFRSN